MANFLNKRLKILLLVFLAAILLLSFKTSYQRIGAFGCFDQCFNFVAAYFMLKGKILYSQIFFNHQPLMPFFSYLIQKLFSPQTIYHLVLYHRLFILFFSLFMNLLFIIRFKWIGFGFVLFYETTKYYLFGGFFLPEAMVAYFLAYNLGLCWEKTNSSLTPVDYLTASVFCWMVIFLTLPYLPVALVLYGLILFPLKPEEKKGALVSSLIFLLLTFIILSRLPLKDYLFDLIVVNRPLIIGEAQRQGLSGLGIVKAFLYPFLILLKGEKTFFHSILIGLDIVFLSLSIKALKNKNIKEVLIFWLVLGLAGIRLVTPGKMFYEAFHLLSWYSLFLTSIFILLDRQKGVFALSLILAFVFAYAFFSPQAFFWEKVNPQEEFTVNYAHPFAHGEVIKILSKPKDTLFLDMWDDLIYWQSGLDSPYRYSLYTPAMTQIEKFKAAREEMFQKNPPDFYYSFYGASQNCDPLFPQKLKPDYLQLYFSDKPTCLYLKKIKLPDITAEQWQEVKKLGFYLPEAAN